MTNHQTQTIPLSEFRAEMPDDDPFGPVRVQKLPTAVAGERDEVDMFLVIVNPQFGPPINYLFRIRRRQLRTDCPNASGGPTIHGRVPKAEEAVPSIPDETLHVIFVLHADDGSSCRCATQPQKWPGYPVASPYSFQKRTSSSTFMRI